MFFSLPFLEFHASHLAFPFKSAVPGLSAQNRTYTFGTIRSNMYGLLKKYFYRSTTITSINIPNDGLLVEAVQMQQLLVCRSGLHFLYILCILLKFSLQPQRS